MNTKLLLLTALAFQTSYSVAQIETTQDTIGSSVSATITASNRGPSTTDCDVEGNATCSATASVDGEVVAQTSQVSTRASMSAAERLQAFRERLRQAGSSSNSAQNTSTGITTTTSSTSSSASGLITAGSNGNSVDCNTSGNASCTGTASSNGETVTESSQSVAAAPAPVVAQSVVATEQADESVESVDVVTAEPEVTNTSTATVVATAGGPDGNTVDCDTQGVATCSGSATSDGETVTDAVSTSDEEPAAPSDVSAAMVSGDVYARCGAGQFEVGFNVAPTTSCTLDQALTIDGEDFPSSNDSVGSYNTAVALPLNSVASISVTLSCTNEDGTFGGQAGASTQSGCQQNDDASDEVDSNVEALQAAVATLLNNVDTDVNRVIEGVAARDANGVDSARYKASRIRIILGSVNRGVATIERNFKDKVTAVELDQAVTELRAQVDEAIASI